MQDAKAGLLLECILDVKNYVLSLSQLPRVGGGGAQGSPWLDPLARRSSEESEVELAIV